MAAVCPWDRLRWLRGAAITDIKDPRVRDRFDLGALHGAAITEIDAIPLRGRRSLITAPVSSRFAAVLLTSQYGNQLGLSVEIMREPRNRTGFRGEDTPTQRGALRWEGQPDVRTRVGRGHVFASSLA